MSMNDQRYAFSCGSVQMFTTVQVGHHAQNGHNVMAGPDGSISRYNHGTLCQHRFHVFWFCSGANHNDPRGRLQVANQPFKGGLSGVR